MKNMFLAIRNSVEELGSKSGRAWFLGTLYFMVATKNYTQGNILPCRGKFFFDLGRIYCCICQWMEYIIDSWVLRNQAPEMKAGWKVLNYTRSHCLMKIWTGKAGSCVRPKYVRTGSFGSKMVITEPFLRTAGIIILTARIYDNCSILTAGGIRRGLGKAHYLLVRFQGGHLGQHIVFYANQI